jgi:hypothetical protein
MHEETGNYTHTRTTTDKGGGEEGEPQGASSSEARGQCEMRLVPSVLYALHGIRELVKFQRKTRMFICNVIEFLLATNQLM